MTATLFTPDALADLFEAVEEVLSTWTYPDPLINGSEPVCYLHLDALVALEDAYDRVIDLLVDPTADAEVTHDDG